MKNPRIPPKAMPFGAAGCNIPVCGACFRRGSHHVELSVEAGKAKPAAKNVLCLLRRLRFQRLTLREG
jgi:hypothetical protein